MRAHWEKLGIQGPVYRLVGQCFSDNEIAGRWNVSQDNVRHCVAWLLRFGSHASRAEFIRDASLVPISANSEPKCAVAKEAS